MTNLQRLIDKHNLLIFISTIVKNYIRVFLTASELRQNCGIKLIIFQINLNKNSSIGLNLELLNVRIYGERKKGKREDRSLMITGEYPINIYKNWKKHAISRTSKSNSILTLTAPNFIPLKIN